MIEAKRVFENLARIELTLKSLFMHSEKCYQSPAHTGTFEFQKQRSLLEGSIIMLL